MDKTAFSQVIDIPDLGVHQHEISHYPNCAKGYGVCECGATIRVEHGQAIGEWHTCATCAPKFYGGGFDVVHDSTEEIR